MLQKSLTTTHDPNLEVAMGVALYGALVQKGDNSISNYKQKLKKETKDLLFEFETSNLQLKLKIRNREYYNMHRIRCK